MNRRQQETMNRMDRIRTLFFSGPWNENGYKEFNKIMDQLEADVRYYQVFESKYLHYESHRMDLEVPSILQDNRSIH
jgi:hypothetical protein